MLKSLGGILFCFGGFFCCFFSLSTSQCQKVSVLIWYRKLQNMPSEKKKKSIGNTRKLEYGAVAALGFGQTCLVHWDPERIAWRVTGCSRIFNYFFEEGRTSPSCCEAQNRRHVPPRSLLLQIWGRGWVCGFFPPQFRFQCKESILPGWKRSRGWKREELCPRAGAAGRSCEAERSAEAQIAAPRGSALGMTDWPARPSARGEAAPTEVCMDLHRPGGKCPLCPVCLDRPKRLFSFLLPKNFLSDKRRSLLAFNLQN